MRITIFLLIIGIFLFSCDVKKAQNKIKDDNASHVDTKVAIINDLKLIPFLDDSCVSFWIPTKLQMSQIDTVVIASLLLRGKSNNWGVNPSSFKQYYRQYICYINENGDQLVYINSFIDLSILEPEDALNWKNTLICYKDGGSSFWQMKINFSKKTCVFFMENGSA